MIGKILVFGLLFASVLVTSLASRTDTVSSDTSIVPSATPQKQTTGTPAAPQKRTTGTPAATPRPRKPKSYIGGSDDGSSMRPAGDVSAASVTEKKPSGADLLRKKNQDIEVENDETHILGSGRRSAAPANGSANRRSTPRNTRTETVDNNETITVHRGVNETGKSEAKSRVRKGTVRKGSQTRSVRRPATRKTAGKRVIK